MKPKALLALFGLLLLAAAGSAETKTFSLTIKASQHDSRNVPICVPLTLPKAFANQDQAFLKGDGAPRYGQLTRPGLMTAQPPPLGADSIRRELHFIVPEIKAGTTLALSCTIHSSKSTELHQFVWRQSEDGHTDLGWLGDQGKIRPILRYMHRPYDDSSPDARNKSYKVFHHLYDPEGKRFVTNGGQTDPYTNAKDLLYPHHRGLMYGFNRITYDNGKTADTWHCPPADPKKKRTENYVEHVKTLSQEAGPVLGRHQTLIDWHGSKNDVFAQENREVTVYNVPGGTLVDFASRLHITNGPVKLDGDPQHAGFQFRASNDIVTQKTAKQTYYLRVGGKGKPGTEINWTPKKPLPETINVPWKAMSFVLDGKRYTVAYLDDPKNPGEHRHSERDYGRFGCYFEYELTRTDPLLVHYRVWLQDGETSGPQVAALAADFVSPPTVTVK